MKNKIFRILLLPIGLLTKLIELANDGARDIQNKQRFKGAIIDKGNWIDQKTKIQPNSHILSNCIINNSNIDSYTYIGRNSIVQNTSIGKFCSIANDVFIGLGKHPLDLFSTSPIFYRRNNPIGVKLIQYDLGLEEYSPIKIGHDVWIGARAIVLDGVTIGNGAVVAANTVVTKDIPDYAIIAGSPGKIIRYRLPDEKIKELQDIEWWTNELGQISDIVCSKTQFGSFQRKRNM